MKKRSPWMQRHLKDPYVKQAQAQGYVSRAAFKLLEIQEKEHILKPGMIVVDLGAAPGGWSQVAKEIVGDKGRVIALDLLPLEISDIEFIQGDFREEAILQELLDRLGGQAVDVVISDMAPNLSGQKSIDQPRTAYLVELALDCTFQILKPGGTFLSKVFQGAGADEVIVQLKSRFSSYKAQKPAASRSKSSEVYLLAKGFLG